ncbi:Urea transporter [compost metagenome]
MLNTASIVYLFLSVIVTTVGFAAVSAAFEPLGMPALTLPFVLVVWVFVLASPLFPGLQKNTSN